MKNIILGIVFVLTSGTIMNAKDLNNETFEIKTESIEITGEFGVNYEEISNLPVLSFDNYDYQKAKVLKGNFNILLENTKIELAPGCTSFGGFIFAAAIESGMSYEDSWDLGVAAVNVCNALVLIGQYL